MVFFHFKVYTGACIIVGIGPLHCSGPFYMGSITTFALLGVILLMAGVCMVVAVCKSEDKVYIRFCSFCIAAILGIAFLVIVAVNSIYAFDPMLISAYMDSSTTTCYHFLTILATTSFAYLLIIFFCCCWFCCCYLLMKSED